MVTHTPNLCSAFTHQSAHTQHTHPEQWQPFILRCPGSSWGFGALLKGTSVVVLRVKRALYIPSPHLQFLPARDSNSQTLDYESHSHTIRPLDSCWCFFSSVHLTHFLQGSDQRNGHSRSLVLCSVIHFCVVFEVDVWIIVRFLTESVTYWFFICWYLIESMMSCV